MHHRAAAGVAAAGGDVDQVHLPVQYFGDLYPVGQGIAPLLVRQLGPAHAHLDGEVRTAVGADPPDDLQHEAAAILKAPAVLVPPVVGEGGKELVDQPAVAGVEGHHLETGQLGHRRALAVGVGDLMEEVHAHGLHVIAPGGPDGAGPVGDVVAGEHGIGLPAAVVDLDGGHRPVAADRLSQRHQGGQHVGVGEQHRLRMGQARAVDDHIPHGDDAGAPLGPELIVGDILQTGMPTGPQGGQRSGGGGHAVAQGERAHFQRAA